MKNIYTHKWASVDSSFHTSQHALKENPISSSPLISTLSRYDTAKIELGSNVQDERVRKKITHCVRHSIFRDLLFSHSSIFFNTSTHVHKTNYPYIIYGVYVSVLT